MKSALNVQQQISKKNVAHIHKRILLGYKKWWTLAICIMDENRMSHAKKSEGKKVDNTRSCPYAISEEIKGIDNGPKR